MRLIVPQVRPLLTAARRSDAESIVLQAAVAAHAEREATGALPRTLAALAGGDAELAERYADVVLEPRADGGLRLSHARFADAESGAPVVLELAGR